MGDAARLSGQWPSNDSFTRLKHLPSLNLDGALETNIAASKFARRDPLKNHMHLRAEHPPPRHDTVKVVPACLVARFALNDRLERLGPVWVGDLVTSDQVSRGAIVDSAKNLSGNGARAMAGKARHCWIGGKPFGEGDFDDRDME